MSPPAASLISDFWNDQIVAHDQQAVFLVLVGFILSFGFIRLSTRLMRSPRVPWWPGSVVSEGGLHVHHLVFGICTMLIAGTVGFAAFGSSPTIEICAALFGVGAGLTIDEFALWVYLDDVYWSKEGRSSVDAMVIAAAAMVLVVMGVRPFDVGTDSAWDVLYGIAGAVLLFAFVAVCFAKERVLHGVVGFFILPVAVYGAARTGKPGSLWAKRFYGERRPDKQAKAVDRFRPDRRTERVKNRFRDLVGGAPDEEPKGPTDATADIRQRADRVAAAEAEETAAGSRRE